MRKYSNIQDIQNMIISKGVAHLRYDANNMSDLIHPFSIPDYEYLSGELVEFLDRFKPVIPKNIPIVLEITGTRFNEKEKKTIDNAIWMHYGLYLSEAAENLKKNFIKIILYLIFTVLSSVLLFMVSDNADEVIVNYGYLLFWFFGYRVLTRILLDCLPIYKEYQWYRRLASLKLVFEDETLNLDASNLSKEAFYYNHEANVQTRKGLLVDRVFMEGKTISLGCRIESIEDILLPSGVENFEIISDEMTDYLMGALPFIKKNSITHLEIEGASFSEDVQKRIVKAIRNHLAFTISQQDELQKDNTDTSLIFGVCLVISTIILSVWGKKVNIAVHEFFLVSLWFFADYLLELILLTRKDIQSTKKTIEKLANMDITFKS